MICMKDLIQLSNLPSELINTVESPPLSNRFVNHFGGLVIMALNKIRHDLKGYTSARGFDFSKITKAIEYDFRVLRRWKDYLEEYEVGAGQLKGKNLLELGPGADLGIGLISLAAGAESYHALDIHNLVRLAPDAFYESLFDGLKNDPNLKAEISFLREQLKLNQEDKSDRLNYVCRKDFDISVFAGADIDLVVSNSAIQQFDDPARSIAQISQVVRPGAYFIALIDLRTHTRWIKQRDPLNIYRYQNSIYEALKFRGSQNRVRPFEFQEMLQDNGWENVKIIPRTSLDPLFMEASIPSLTPRFRAPENQMELLRCMICAKMGGG